MKAIIDLPPTTNSAYALSRSRMYKTQACRDWEEAAGYEILNQWDKEEITGNVYVGMELFYRHNRDVDGSIKFILDLLADVGVYKNDKQVVSITATKEKTINQPCVVITVLPHRG